MKTLALELPDKLATEIANLVKAGWFVSEAEVTRQALADFLRRFQPQLQEEHQLQDIAWAVEQRKSAR